LLDKAKKLIKKNIFSRIVPPPGLETFIRDTQFKVLDVGARGGVMKQFIPLAPFVKLYLCEPDQKETGRLQKKSYKWDITVIPAALGTLEGKLRLTKFPGLSSLLDPDIDLIRRYEREADIERWNVEHIVNVPMMTLDEAGKKFKFFDDLSFIKLDTQGTELNILESGNHVVSSLIAVFIEIEVQPLYKKQPLFSEVHSYLDRHNFQLIDLKRTLRRRQVSNPPACSKQELVYMHALYLKHDLRRARELVCIALAFWYFDLALELSRAYGFKIEEDIHAYANQVLRVCDRQRRDRMRGLFFRDKKVEY